MDFLLRISALPGDDPALLAATRAEPACAARRPVGGPGSSILMMSAPRSPRIIVQNGPGASFVRSRILIPLSGATAGILNFLLEARSRPNRTTRIRIVSRNIKIVGARGATAARGISSPAAELAKPQAGRGV